MADGLEITFVVFLEFALVTNLAGNLAAGLVGIFADGYMSYKIIDRRVDAGFGGAQSRGRTIGIESDGITTGVTKDKTTIWSHLQSDLVGEVE